MNSTNKKIKERLAKLPRKPGVYFFKDKKGKIIYIGKANDLRARVRQYFTREKDRHPKILALVAEIARQFADISRAFRRFAAKAVRKNTPEYFESLLQSGAVGERADVIRI